MEKTKPKIAVIGLKGLPAFGGAAAVGENLIEELKEKYDFTVLSVASHADISFSSFNGYKQIVFRNFGRGALNTLLYYLRSMVHVLINNYDLIHLHHAESGFITPFLRFKYNVLVTFHGAFNVLDPKFNKITNDFFKLSEFLNLKFANIVTSVSKANISYFQKRLNRRIYYIPNGVNVLDLCIDKIGDKIVFSASRIYSIKGLHLLIKALEKINFKGKLFIIGSFEHEKGYKSQIDELIKSINVAFVGLVKNKKKLYSLIAQSSLFVFPSIYEAMSMMLLEAASVKTPIIASDIEANTYIFNESEITFFQSNNVIDLAEKIHFCIEKPNILKQKAEMAYQKVVNNYNWKSISNLYNQHYLELI